MTTAVQSPEEISLQIEGMHCGSCVSHVDKALRSVPGVIAAAVNLTTNSATVQGSAGQAEIVAAVERAGYKARVVEDLSAKTLREIEARGDAQEAAVRGRLMVGFLFGVPAVVVEMMLHHADFWARHFGIGMHPGYNVFAGMLATVVVVVTGMGFFTRGVKAAWHKNPTMDTLVALGAGTAYVASAVSLAVWLWRVEFGAAEGMWQPAISEFHAAVVIIVLVTLGKYLEARAKKRASSAVANLASQSSPTATRIRPDGTLETIPAEHVQRGDIVQVLAHQQLPVDGVVVQGAGSVDLSIITGESLPLEVSPPAPSTPPPTATPTAPAKKSLSLNVLAAEKAQALPQPTDARENILPGGATLLDGRIALRATSTAAGSTVARILQLVNHAQAGKTQIQGLADKVAAVFVPAVLLVAAANFTAHLFFHGGWQAALLTSIATLIIACPCAMGLATPAAITVAMGRAAKLGILFTNPRALETARAIKTVIFDKTGTLTTGHPHLAEVLGISYEDTPQGPTHAELTVAGQHALIIAAGLEQYSEHPLAQALLAAAKKFSLPLRIPEKFSSVPGGGVTATIDQRSFAVGSLAFAQSMHVDLSAVAADIDRLKNDGKTLSVLVEMAAAGETPPTARPPRLLGLFAFQDTLRPDAKETVHALRERGFKVGVLSGDTELAVRGAIQNMAVDFLKSAVSPAQKALEVTALKAAASQSQKKGSATAFIGDGVNDAPALASADLGIAMASATQIARTSGDVLLMSNKLHTILALFGLSEKTLRVIKQNLFWAFAYNVVAIPLAMLGILPPAAAAAAMILSSLSVVANALRLRRMTLT